MQTKAQKPAKSSIVKTVVQAISYCLFCWRHLILWMNEVKFCCLCSLFTVYHWTKDRKIMETSVKSSYRAVHHTTMIMECTANRSKWFNELFVLIKASAIPVNVWLRQQISHFLVSSRSIVCLLKRWSLIHQTICLSFI